MKIVAGLFLLVALLAGNLSMLAKPRPEIARMDVAGRLAAEPGPSPSIGQCRRGGFAMGFETSVAAKGPVFRIQNLTSKKARFRVSGPDGLVGTLSPRGTRDFVGFSVSPGIHSVNCTIAGTAPSAPVQILVDDSTSTYHPIGLDCPQEEWVVQYLDPLPSDPGKRGRPTRLVEEAFPKIPPGEVEYGWYPVASGGGAAVRVLHEGEKVGEFRFRAGTRGWLLTKVSRCESLRLR